MYDMIVLNKNDNNKNLILINSTYYFINYDKINI